MNTRGLISLVILLSAFISCKKDAKLSVNQNETVANQRQSAEAISEAFNLSQELFLEDQLTNQLIENDKTNARQTSAVVWPMITYDPNRTAFPRTITVDWGTNNVGPDGKFRSGKTITRITGEGLNVGDMRILSYDNYKINNGRFTQSLGGGRTSTVRSNDLNFIVGDVKTDLTRTSVLNGDNKNYVFNFSSTEVLTIELSTSISTIDGSEEGIREPIGTQKLFRWRSTYRGLTRVPGYAFIIAGFRSDDYAFIGGDFNIAGFKGVTTEYNTGRGGAALDDVALVTYNKESQIVTLPLDPYATFKILY